MENLEVLERSEPDWHLRLQGEFLLGKQKSVRPLRIKLGYIYDFASVPLREILIELYRGKDESNVTFISSGFELL